MPSNRASANCFLPVCMTENSVFSVKELLVEVFMDSAGRSMPARYNMFELVVSI